MRTKSVHWKRGESSVWSEDWRGAPSVVRAPLSKSDFIKKVIENYPIKWNIKLLDLVKAESIDLWVDNESVTGGICSN